MSTTDNVSPAASAATVRNLCAMFGAAALVDAFTHAKAPARLVAAMLTESTGSNRAISAAGVERVRLQLLQRGKPA